MMLKLRVSPRLMTEALDNGLFYHIRLARMPLPVNPIRAFVLDEHMLSSSKILSEMYCLVRKFLKTYKGLIFTSHLLLLL